VTAGGRVGGKGPGETAQLRPQAVAQDLSGEPGGQGAAGAPEAPMAARQAAEATSRAGGMQKAAQILDGQLQQEQKEGGARTVEVAGEGELPLDLPDKVLFGVLARVPIIELHMLLRERVSSRFAAAIRKVFLEIASEAVRRACNLDEQGAVEDKAYEHAFKARFIVSPPSPWVDRAYSDSTCS
jgi:hypothetical protein